MTDEDVFEVLDALEQAEGLADHVVVSRSEHIPRIQEAQASAYHVLRELVELHNA
jgi:hypothetical protein